jgi:hypothetical protein
MPRTLIKEIDVTKTEEMLVKELRAARVAIRKMKDECNQYDEGFKIGKDSLRRINGVLKEFKQPVAQAA